ncbi:hypothetical protein BDR05DRAFT_995147 [Suillus weaverae]|nr:hypothetical protein BDR05DRAFT_995147 [Suillus weaverae]
MNASALLANTLSPDAATRQTATQQPDLAPFASHSPYTMTSTPRVEAGFAPYIQPFLETCVPSTLLHLAPFHDNIDTTPHAGHR